MENLDISSDWKHEDSSKEQCSRCMQLRSKEFVENGICLICRNEGKRGPRGYEIKNEFFRNNMAVEINANASKIVF